MTDIDYKARARFDKVLALAVEAHSSELSIDAYIALLDRIGDVKPEPVVYSEQRNNL